MRRKRSSARTSPPPGTGLALAITLPFALALVPLSAAGEVVNGSFETPEGAPSLAGWNVSSGTSAPGGPPGGGSWCLSLAKDLLAATAWQDVAGAPDPVTWRLTAWVRNDAATEGTVIVRWCVRRGFDPEVLEPLGERQITLSEWTQATVDVTPQLEKEDTLAVCLLVVSQMSDQHTGYVDIVSAGPLVPVEGVTWGRIKSLYRERAGGRSGRGEIRSGRSGIRSRSGVARPRPG